jgi:predicted DNA-binding transcriptional regulator YafY
MGRKKANPTPPTLTAARAARLYKLLTLLGTGPQTRRLLLSRLKLDVRGFYRDLETLRRHGIEITAAADNRYSLTGTLDDALANLPFPDPGLNVRDALQLAIGTTSAHKKLRLRVNSFLQGARSPRSGGAKPTGPNKPR